MIEIWNETGLLPGIKLAFTHSQDDSHFQLHASQFDRNVDYDGQTQGGTPHQTETDTRLFKLGFKIIPEKINLLPGRLFIGVQHWRWERDILTRNNVQGLHEIYSWQEMELGIQFKSDLVRQSWYWLDLSGLYIFSPNMDIRLPTSTVKLDLGSEFGFRLRTGKTWQGNDTTQLSLGLFAEYWEFGRSNTVFTPDFYGRSAYLTEPRSESFHSGVELSFLLHF